MEKIVKDIREMPVLLGVRMNELRQLDAQSRHLAEHIEREEEILFEEMSNIGKAYGAALDEEPFMAKFQQLMALRQELLALSDAQMKKAQQTYDTMDKKIALVDECTKPIAHLLTAEVEKGGTHRKKKKRKSSGAHGGADWASRGGTGMGADGDGRLAQLGASYEVDINNPDMNEPLYCKCNRISYGQMVGCENPDCPIEWYHFGCVGLTDEPADPWFCPLCIEQAEKSVQDPTPAVALSQTDGNSTASSTMQNPVSSQTDKQNETTSIVSVKVEAQKSEGTIAMGDIPPGEPSQHSQQSLGSTANTVDPQVSFDTSACVNAPTTTVDTSKSLLTTQEEVEMGGSQDN